MMTARLRLRYPELRDQGAVDSDGLRSSTPPFKVSYQQQLRCNPYTQGCDGGYPYLVGLWSAENPVVSAECED